MHTVQCPIGRNKYWYPESKFQGMFVLSSQTVVVASGKKTDREGSLFPTKGDTTTTRHGLAAKNSDNTAEEICLLRGGWAMQQADAIPKSIVAAQNNDNLPSVLFRVSSSICLALEESWADKKFCNFTWWWAPGCRVVWISVNWANRVGWGFQQSVTEATAGRSVF